METKKEIFNEMDALKLIEQTITTTRQKFNDNGVLLILWGWIVIVGNVINYFGQTLNIVELFWYWPIVCTAGGIFSGIYGARQEKKKGAKSHINNFMKYVWSASGISAVLLWSAATYLGWEYINPAMFVAFGVPVLITGGVIQFKPVIVGGLILFVFGIITFLLVESEFQPLVAALGFLLGYVVPGYLLNKIKYE